MKRLAIVALTLLAISWTAALAAPGDGRVALIIGNSAYSHVPSLENPLNDADAVARSLREAGFSDVTLVADADYREMRLKLQEFSRKVPGSEIALVYFAGHGIEVGGTNYLIPTDARLAEASDVEFETINFDTVMNAMADARKLRMFILDACRDNPFIAGMKRTGGTRSIGRGLARVEPEANTLVAYAAKSGTQALDGDGANSPYASALVAELSTPGIEVGYLFRRVRDRVLEETGGRQEPFTYGSLGGEPIYLAAAGAAPADAGPNMAGPQGAGPQGAGGSDGASVSLLTEAATAWAAIKDTSSRGVLAAYISRYQGTVFADIAAARLEEIKAGHGAGTGAGTAGTGIGDQAGIQTLPPPAREPSFIAREPGILEVGKWAEGIAYDGRHIWVSESGQRTIAAVDPDTGKIDRRVKVGRLPVDMDAISDGRTFSLVHTDKLVWQQHPGGGRGGALTRLGECPEALAASDAAVWVVTLPDCSSGSSRAVRIDLASGRQTQTGNLGEWAQAIALSHGRAWVAHARDGLISSIDANSLAVERSYVDQASLWAITTNSAGVHAGGRIDNDNESGLIATLDPRTGEELYRHPVSSRVAAMTADESNVVAVGDNGDVWVLSADGSELLNVISLGTGPFYASDVLIARDIVVISRQQANGENGALLAIGDWRGR